MANLQELLLADAGAWGDWLAEHHSDSPGVWLVLHKKGGRTTALTYAQALDEALCFGWIDGQVAKRDEQTYRQRFTPRRPGSAWSARNVGHVDRLAASGRMHPAGAAAVTAAKADGRWQSAYAGQANAETPPDLRMALDGNPAAAAAFASLSGADRYSILYRLKLRQAGEHPPAQARRVHRHPQHRRAAAASPQNTALTQSVLGAGSAPIARP